MVPESQIREYKQSVSEWREIVETIAAFATANGGMVHIGITPDGRRVGLQIGQDTLEQLANRIRQNTDPPQYPSIIVEGDTDNAVILLRIEECPIKPVWAFNRPMKRVGATNQHLTRDEANWLVEQTTGRTWDALPHDTFTTADIDRAAVQAFLRRAELDREMVAEALLNKLRLHAKNGALCNAAPLLFAEEPCLFVNSAQLKCGRFLGKEPVNFLDEQTLTGNVLSQFDDALKFIIRNTKQGIKIGRTERERLPEYPDEAVREALINAICHRDYTSPGTIQVRIYDNRMEIWNPGRLPFDLTIAELYREHASRPRNLLLAEILFRLRMIERWGTGTNRILSTCKPHGIVPTFREAMGNFIVTFPLQEQFVAIPESLQLSERQHKAIEYVFEHGSVNNTEYQQLFAIGKTIAARELSALAKAGVFIPIASGRSTRYSLLLDSRIQAGVDPSGITGND